jgi:hypothetical protein
MLIESIKVLYTADISRRGRTKSSQVNSGLTRFEKVPSLYLRSIEDGLEAGKLRSLHLGAIKCLHPTNVGYCSRIAEAQAASVLALLPNVHSSSKLVKLFTLRAKKVKGVLIEVYMIVDIPEGIAVSAIIIIDNKRQKQYISGFSILCQRV